MAQTLALVLAGGAVGAGLAVAAVAVAGSGPWTSEVGVPRIPTALGVFAVSMLLGIGLLAGLFPARAAARLDPVEALRG